MPEIQALLPILFISGIAAGVINVMAGGGSTITLPVLILLGLDAGVANGTNRVAIIVQNIVAVLTFSNDKKTRLKASLRFALWTIPGAIAGAFFGTQIDDGLFEKILAGILILIVVSMLIPSNYSNASPETAHSIWAGPSLLAVGIYGGFIQVGVGFMLMAVFVHLLRLDLLTTTVHKLTIVLLYTTPALLLYALMGKVDWLLGLVLAAGNAFGAFIAARMALRRGEKVIRIVLMVAIVIMAFRMLGVV